jgi:dihydroneopterin triphosphate diphosphatase
MPGFVSNTVQVHIARNNSGKSEFEFLLLQRSVNNVIYPGIWQVITGTIEVGESALQTALREVNEETGVVATDIWTLPYITHFFDPGKDLINASPVFGVLFDDNTKISLSPEHSDYKWLNMDECQKLLPLPSHKEGTKIFMEYVLMKEDRNMFKVEL